MNLNYVYLSNLQVTMKPNPHPERPDRLRAIMGGLEAAGKIHRKQNKHSKAKRKRYQK